MQPDRTLLKTTGFLYLTMIVVTAVAYSIVMTLAVGEPAEVVAKLRESLPLFQFAIVGFGVGLTAYVFLGLWLFRLFRPVHEAVATVLLVLVSIHAAISLVGIAPLMDALTLVRGPMLVEPGELPAQVALKIANFTTTWRVSFIFSGLWLYPLGWLVYRCGFLPRFVGIAAMVGSVSYVLAFVGWVLDPAYDTSLVGRVVGVVSGLPSLVGEAGTCISLLIAGFKGFPKEPVEKQKR